MSMWEDPLWMNCVKEHMDKLEVNLNMMDDKDDWKYSPTNLTKLNKDTKKM